MAFGFATANGLSRAATIGQPCGPACGQPWNTRTYDANSNPMSYVDFNGNTTATTYSAAALLTQQIDAKGQATQRTTNFTWDTTLRVPLTRTVLDNNGNTVASASWVYNAYGQATARCEADPTVTGAASYTCGSSTNAPAGVRQWRYTYCNAVDTTQCPLTGLLLSVDGPRTDVSDITNYSYYLSADESGCGTAGGACHRAGDVYTVANALGQITTVVAYDKNGRVVRQSSANGVITDLAYSPRGWLLTRTVRANADGSASPNDAVTTVGYTAYGSVASIQDADGVTVNYTYDAAHRLTKITDALGNYVQYTLDAAGNKTAEQTYDSSGTLRRSLSRTFNTLGQLTKVTDGLSHAVFNAVYSDSYDANGNLVHTGDALGVQRKQGYDGLNRLITTIDNYSGTDTATQNTQSAFAYDANDRLEGVSDPDGLNTTYSYDGLGNATGVQSPDTGSTTYVYDAGGNVTQRTDAKGVVSNSTYDALNRRTATTYADGTLNVAYAYDEANSVTGCPASYPVGRLTRIIETAVTTVYCYDAHGNVTRKSQTQGTVTDVTAYGYTLADRLASTLTPAGTSIQYSRDAAGRISGVTALPPGTSGAGAGNVVTAISYLPFGPIASYTLGNGQTITRTYDANYAVTDVVSPALNLHFARDAMGNITALGNASGASPATETYAYDPLYRLTGLYDASTNPEETYTYSKTGDRLSKTGNGLATGAYTYQTGTHHLTAIGNAARTYDANGNTTGSVIGGDTFGYGYNGRNRMTVVQRDGSTVGTYTYNVLGQRTAKVATFPSASSQRFAYDEASQLIGEYGSNSRDYVWLGDLPVATVDTASGVSTVSYVHADGLGTPRAIANTSGNTIWQLAYQTNAFGEQQPTSANGFVYGLRLPGQYYDAESGLANNVNRDYEAATGRYLQSDPIGLDGGLSTFAYVDSSPLNFFDPLGTSKLQGTNNIGGNDPLTPRLNAQSNPDEVRRAIKAAEDAERSGALNANRLRQVRAWLKVAKRNFTRAECPPLFFEVLEMQMGQLCEEGNPIGCSMYQGLGGTVIDKTQM
ncbi:RHS repeat-associated core domain-containing protein [Dyella terrae]|uniref:RHS repeat-associated core domain-containing protein n=1 Tax=Dyella terrae TaxID=522259 RepID=UPI001EFE17BE|nr:RHS repeat-associated core domain-containing protein [Dyella terrae]